MKKKGFTLIELLAVIVILAIIALIATPIILNIISDSKEESNKRSVELYGKAVEQAIAKSQLNGSEIPAGDYTTTDGKTLTKDNVSFEVQYSGSEVTCTTNKLYEDGSIYLAGCRVGTDTKEYTYGKQMVVKLCTANTTRVNALVYDISVAPPEDVSAYKPQEVGLIASESGAYTPGVAYTCELGAGEEIFYVLEENGDNVTLILGKNLGDNISDSSALAKLKERTTGWTKLKENQITLPSAQQIAIAAGYQKWDDRSIELPTWLTSYTEYDGGSQGYWTSTQYEYMDCCNESGEPYVYLIKAVPVIVMNGELNIVHPSDYGYSVRPVITVSKSNLS